MSPHLVLEAAAVVLCLYDGVVHAIHARLSRRREVGWFALTCLAVAAFGLATLGLHTAATIPEAVRAQRLQYLFLSGIAISLLEFLHRGPRLLRRPHARRLEAAFAAVAILGWWGPPAWTVDAHFAARRTLGLPGWGRLQIWEAPTGPVYSAQLALVLIALGFMVAGARRQCRLDPAEGRRYTIALTLFAAAAFNDVLVTAEVYDFYYLGDLAFVSLVVLMKVALLRENVRMNEALHRLNGELEQKIHTRTAALERAYQRLKAVSLEDPLTRLPNRRSLTDRFERSLQHLAGRIRDDRRVAPAALGLAVIDIDDFKRVNDELGHNAGDDAIAHVARVATETLRDVDVIGRWGGEEFVVLLPDTDLEGAQVAMDEVRRAITDARCPALTDGRRLTVTIGVTALTEPTRLERAVAVADQALYVGKRSGKDRVVARPMTTPSAEAIGVTATA